MRHAVAGKLLIHQNRLFVRHVGVVGPMNQQRRGIRCRHLSDRAEPVEGLWLRAGIDAGDFLRPEPVLAAVKVEARSLVPPAGSAIASGPTAARASASETSGWRR